MRDIACSIFTIWCNKHNQHFIVTQNTHPISCSTNSHIAILLEELLCKFIISLNDIPITIRFVVPRSLGPKPYQLIKFWINLISHLPPINSTPRSYLRVTWNSVPCVTWEAVKVVETTHCTGFTKSHVG
jgi:hypothetical protein